MANLEPIREAWKQYIKENQTDKWCESIIFLMEIFDSDHEFKVSLIDEANEFFRNKLDDDGKTDVFFSLLGKIK